MGLAALVVKVAERLECAVQPRLEDVHWDPATDKVTLKLGKEAPRRPVHQAVVVIDRATDLKVVNRQTHKGASRVTCPMIYEKFFLGLCFLLPAIRPLEISSSQHRPAIQHQLFEHLVVGGRDGNGDIAGDCTGRKC